ncbi:MAG: MBL fold metallo-hydrolase [Paludibacter sp.]|nr:MBL fold metallo-hydrolase [Paludibacter sp.]
MRLKVLSDNRILLNALEKEHGLCIYVETEKYKCLLDTGASDNFIQNAAKMEVDIEDIDYVFVSHGHSDHIGGLMAFLNQNSKAKIIISKNALSQQFFSVRKGLRDISSELDIRPFKHRFVFVDSDTVFETDIHVFPCLCCSFPMPKANKTLMKIEGNELVYDDFNHELIICFGAEHLIVYTGCAHCGILNILDSVKKTVNKPISALIGGFHLLDSNEGQYETEKEINEIVERLTTDFPETHFYTGHCTGDKVYSMIKQKLDKKLNWFYTGYTFNI